MTPPKPSLPTQLFYGFGSVAYGVKDQGFAFFLLLYYNQVLGLPERWVGLGILIALVLDALSDPVVGYVSDHLKSRWGRRHPFMYFAALPVGVAYYFLWNPPAGLSEGALLAYFIVISVLVRQLITFYEVPSSSLVAELAYDYDQRTSLLSYRYFFGWTGGLTMSVLAYTVFLQPDADHPVGVLNPAGYRDYAIAAGCIMACAILISASGTHRYIPHLRKPPERPHGFRATLRELRETFSNRSFLALFRAAIFMAMASGLIASLSIYFNTYFWELSSNEISLLVMANFLSAVAALAIAPRVSRQLGKQRGAIGIAAVIIFWGPLPVVLRLLDWFPENGSPLLLPILLLHNTIAVALIITFSILVSAMMADVVEDSEITTGRRTEGLFFAANSFMQKTVSGVGIFASTVVLSLIGFPRGAKPGEVDPEVVRALAIAYVPLLTLLFAIAIGFLSAYGITRTSHADNLRRLAERRATNR